MDESLSLIDDLQKKVGRLVRLQSKTSAESSGMAGKIQELERIIQQQKNKINDLEEKLQIIKITKSLEKGKDTTDVKLKINEMIREIDKCIGLLNS